MACRGLCELTSVALLQLRLQGNAARSGLCEVVQRKFPLRLLLLLLLLLPPHTP